MADEIAAAKVRLAEMTAATYPTAEGQRTALLHQVGYLSGSHAAVAACAPCTKL